MDSNTMSTVSEVLGSLRSKGADFEFRWTPDGFTPGSQDAYGAYSSHAGEDGYDNFIRRIPEKDHVEQLLFEL